MEFNWINTAFYGAGTLVAPLPRACRLDARFSYFLYLPKGFTQQRAADAKICVAVHGTYRDAASLKNRFAAFADATGCVILAPLFPCGIGDRQDIHNYKFIAFQGIRFDAIVLDMVEDVRESFAVAEERFALYGFSGGGQFAHRFFYLHPQRLLAAAIGAPGRASYLDNAAPWPGGTAGFARQFGSAPVITAMQAVPVGLFVGSDDTEQIDCASEGGGAPDVKYGVNRLERTQALHKNYLAHGIHSTFTAVPNAAHEEDKILPAAQQFLRAKLK